MFGFENILLYCWDSLITLPTFFPLRFCSCKVHQKFAVATVGGSYQCSVNTEYCNRTVGDIVAIIL